MQETVLSWAVQKPSSPPSHKDTKKKVEKLEIFVPLW
jgi:hypothetical protein